MIRTTRETIKQFSNFTPCLKLESDSGSLLMITPELGARVLAVSTNGLDGENLLWANPEITESSNNWNIGGARTWIAPEDKFYLDHQDNWFVPRQMDPGHYELTAETAETIECANEFTIRNKEQIEYHVKINRCIQNIAAPIELPDSVQFAGFEFTHSLKNLGESTWGEQVDFMGLWSLIQINPGGTLLVPLKSDSPTAYRNYFNVFTASHFKKANQLLNINIDGKFRGKLGIAPQSAGNLLCYICDRNLDSYMIVKEFTVEPTGTYLDHPWGQPFEYGDPVQLYNDDGQMGGFGEMECHAPAKMLKPNDSQSFSARVNFFTGPVDSLKEIAETAFKIPFGEVAIF